MCVSPRLRARVRIWRAPAACINVCATWHCRLGVTGPGDAVPCRVSLLRQVYLAPTEPLLRKRTTTYRTYSYMI